eukprot:GDKI01002117.1.p1 GENE.GDKI01002117.1~~GDKI01002117.1.p1  ORF type:complete len:947 (-),score=330.89 GDKI01002117.1:22-2772(-)
MSHAKKTALQRLQWDYREMKANPLPTVVAEPLESDWFEWHANVRGAGYPYDQHIFHFILKFPETYPLNPPQITIENTLSHPNIFGSYICLDLLETGQWADKEERMMKYTGWSAAYSVQTILMQLQSFMQEKAYTTRGAVQSSLRGSLRYKCMKKGCMHTYNTPHPPFLEPMPLPDPRTQRLLDFGLGDEDLNRVEQNEELLPARARVGDTETETEISGSGRRLSNSTGAATTPGGMCALPPKGKYFWSDVRAGMCVCGVVTTVMDFGVFVNFGGPRDAMLHRSELTVPLSTLTYHTPVTVYIKSIQGLKINVTQRQILSEEEIKRVCVRGEYVDGWVKGANSRGVYVDVGGHEGFVPRTHLELYENESASGVYFQGDRIRVRVTDVHTLTGVLTLSAIQLFHTPTHTQRARGGAGGVEETQPENSVCVCLPDFLLCECVNYLTLGECLDFGKCSELCQSISDSSFASRKENTDAIRCYYTKHTPLTDKNVVLGVGVQYTRHEKTGKIETLSSPYDYISHTAFNTCGVRMGVWKEQITHFLPLVIDETHFARARTQIEKSMSALCYINAKAENTHTTHLHTSDDLSFDPLMVFDILPRMMNNFVVGMMGGDVCVSSKALEGYCGMHHLFLALAKEYPVIRQTANEKIAAFLSHTTHRHKMETPNLGEFLTYMSVSDTHTWGDVCVSLVEEAFTRNVLWVLKKYPQLCDPTRDKEVIASDRLTKTFKCNAVSLRLLMFQVWFLNNVAHRPHTHWLPETDAVTGVTHMTPHMCRKASCQLHTYNKSKGMPAVSLIDKLQSVCKRIYALPDWDTFFRGVELNRPSDLFLSRWLRRCVLSSLSKVYHRVGQFERQMERERREKEERKEKRTQQAEDGMFGDETIDTRATKTKAQIREQRGEREWQGWIREWRFGDRYDRQE